MPRETDEIEITPEMIAAGVTILALYHQGEDSSEFAEEVVSRIYATMLRLQRSQTAP